MDRHAILERMASELEKQMWDDFFKEEQAWLNADILREKREESKPLNPIWNEDQDSEAEPIEVSDGMWIRGPPGIVSVSFKGNISNQSKGNCM